MTYAGASGDTAREMVNALYFSLVPERLHQAIRSLQTTTRTGEVELRIGNRLWGQRGYHFLPEFLRTTEECYNACLGEVDFKSDLAIVSCEINSWIEQQTNGRIKDMVSPGNLSQRTRLVLASAVYFLGCWESEFEKSLTKQASFTNHDGNLSSVPMMRQTDYFQYAAFDDVQLLEMPYRSRSFRIQGSYPEKALPEVVEFSEGGSDFALCICLPRKTDGLKEIESRLSPLATQSGKLHTDLVDVRIPRFRLETGFMLNRILQSMGMQRAFDIEKAEFWRMTDNPEGIYLGEILHKAFVDVNEKGTEAAAATIVVARGGSASRPQPKNFVADHPFLFLIRDRKTQLIYFMGRVSNFT